MKKILIIVAMVGIVILALGIAGFAYAQSQTPTPVPSYPGYGRGMMGGWGGRGYSGYGPGMMGGRGGFGYGPGMMGGYGFGPMHQYMINALAVGLDLTPEALQTRIANGETPIQIAQAKGLSDEEIRTLFLEAHDASLDQAVEAGLLTQEQADWMDQHMEQIWANGIPAFGFGPCHGGYAPGWQTPSQP